MGVILRDQSLAQRRGHRCLCAGILSTPASQHIHQVILLTAAFMEPPLDRGETKTNRRPTDGEAPFAAGQVLQRGPQRALGRRCCEQRTDN